MNSEQKTKDSRKFMQVLDAKIYNKLRQRAKPLGVTVQELLRVKVIPEFLFGPITLNPELVRRLVKDGYFSANKVKWNGVGKKK